MKIANYTLEKIRDLHREGKLEQAKEGYLTILKQNPQDADALHWLGILHAQQKNYSAAIDTLQQAIEYAPHDNALKLHLANALKLQGLFNQAAQLLEKTFSENPSYLPALHNLGIIYYAQGKLGDAEKIFREVTIREPQYVDAFYNLGLTLSKQNKFSEATLIYENLLQQAPEHFAARFHLACALMQQEKLSAAIEQFLLIEKSQPYHAETQTNLATCYFKQKNLNAAKTHYLKALDIEPRDTQVLFNLGVIAAQQDQIDQAIRHYQMAIQINPDFFAAQNNLGVAFLAKQHASFALQHFQQASRLQPENQSVAYAVKMLAQSERVTVAEPDYIKSLFDAYADHYETHLLTALEYKLPGLLKQAVLNSVALPPGEKDILDLGCGTGLCGTAFKPFAKTLTGVDLSDKMLAVAAEKHIYDRLIASELNSFLRNKNMEYDLVLAGDVLVYVGDLADIFHSIKQALRPNGLLVFNTEISPDKDFKVNQSGRFAHTKRYLEQLAQENHFIILHYQQVITRLQNNEPVYGHLYVLQAVLT